MDSLIDTTDGKAEQDKEEEGGNMGKNKVKVNVILKEPLFVNLKY